MIYRVLGMHTPWQREEKRYGSFVVTDQPVEYVGEQAWPIAAEFKVSMRHDQKTQNRRAFEYCDYLNKGIVVQPPIGT